MPDHETVRRMLDAASRDLQAVSNMLDADRFSEEIFGLHAQQTVEKSLKAWLAWHDQEVPRTHNLRLLLVLLIQAGEEVTQEWAFIDLTAFAVQFRYESCESEYAPMDRNAILKQVGMLFHRVQSIVDNNATDSPSSGETS